MWEGLFHVRYIHLCQDSQLADVSVQYRHLLRMAVLHNVRFFQDFAARLYFMEEVEDDKQ